MKRTQAFISAIQFNAECFDRIGDFNLVFDLLENVRHRSSVLGFRAADFYRHPLPVCSYSSSNAVTLVAIALTCSAKGSTFLSYSSVKFRSTANTACE